MRDKLSSSYQILTLIFASDIIADLKVGTVAGYDRYLYCVHPSEQLLFALWLQSYPTMKMASTAIKLSTSELRSKHPIPCRCLMVECSSLLNTDIVRGG